MKLGPGVSDFVRKLLTFWPRTPVRRTEISPMNAKRHEEECGRSLKTFQETVIKARMAFPLAKPRYSDKKRHGFPAGA
jgi:hypothetical protein